RTAHTLDNRIQPQRQIDPRVRRRTTRHPLYRLHLRIQSAHVQRFDELPHRTRRMVHPEKTVQIHGAQLQLRAVRPHQSGRTLGLRLLALWLSLGNREKRLAHAPSLPRPKANGKPPRPKFLHGLSVHPTDAFTLTERRTSWPKPPVP